ncbi:hypothetical protein C8Q76DRAFT_701555 [Earliella scabrosa]|nr:hypothetical protein C8Q76DRAFT_701555 [Earliella scabrosa]
MPDLRTEGRKTRGGVRYMLRVPRSADMYMVLSGGQHMLARLKVTTRRVRARPDRGGGGGGRNAERLDGTVGETRRWLECAGGRVSGGHVGRTRRRSESYAPSRRDTANGDTGSSLDDQPTKTCSHAAESEKNAPQGRHLDSARGRSGWCRSDQLLALAQVAKHASAEDGAREPARGMHARQRRQEGSVCTEGMIYRRAVIRRTQ